MNWPEDFINKIICKGCIKAMEDMPDNCIDTIITDPPYGLFFMGKKWDYDVPSIEVWEECLRVLKPGGTALIFAGSRTQHRMAVNIEDAGFILKDCIMWLYGSGFPKASDISKQLDKRTREKRIAKKRIRIDDKKTGIAGGSFMSDTVNIDYPEAITPEAKLWNGWKSHGLKPAYEPILVAMKPNEGNYANNALKWGVAGLNIEESRIPYEKTKDPATNPQYRVIAGYKCNHGDTIFEGKFKRGGKDILTKGRYPANVIIDNSPEVKREFGKYKTSGNSYRPTGSRGRGIINGNIPFNKGLKRKGDILGFNDSGSASRFFYCAKASKTERNRGCERLEEKYNDDSRKDKNAIGCNNPNNRSGTPKQNHHPTVKPLSLMKYLCTLTKTPTGGIVLDPFCGSGTTLMACKELKRDYIGIDNNPEYCEIARRRVKAIPESLF